VCVSIVTEQDEDALTHLTDIRLSYLDGTPGFKLTFSFAPNDYFSNSELEKTYYYQSEVGYGGDLIYDRSEGSEISWKEEKDLTKRVEVKKQRNKSEFASLGGDGCIGIWEGTIRGLRGSRSLRGCLLIRLSSFPAATNRTRVVKKVIAADSFCTSPHLSLIPLQLIPTS
jgi:hypothetical protein